MGQQMQLLLWMNLCLLVLLLQLHNPYELRNRKISGHITSNNLKFHLLFPLSQKLLQLNSQEHHYLLGSHLQIVRLYHILPVPSLRAAAGGQTNRTKIDGPTGRPRPPGGCPLFFPDLAAPRRPRRSGLRGCRSDADALPAIPATHDPGASAWGLCFGLGGSQCRPD